MKCSATSLRKAGGCLFLCLSLSRRHHICSTLTKAVGSLLQRSDDLVRRNRFCNLLKVGNTPHDMLVCDLLLWELHSETFRHANV